jgi:hypothetical protein
MVEANVNVWRVEVKKAMTSLKLTAKDVCGAMPIKCEAIQSSLTALR